MKAIAALGLLGAAASVSAALPRYRVDKAFTDPLLYGDWLRPSGMNNRGDVIGQTTFGSYRWSDGSYVSLRESFATHTLSINEARAVVGWPYQKGQPSVIVYADNSHRNLKGNANYPSSIAVSVTNSGLAAGAVLYDNLDYNTRATIWDANTGDIKTIIPPTGTTYWQSWFEAINEKGDGVGYFGDSMLYPGGIPFVSKSGVITKLAEYTAVADINDEGAYIGNNFSGPFINLGGQDIQLGVGNLYTIPERVNNRNEVIGQVRNGDASKGYFYWRNGESAEFTTLFEGLPSNARITSVYDINDSGQIIGCVLIGNNQSYCFRASPVPEPTWGLLAGVGLLALRRRRLPKP